MKKYILPLLASGMCLSASAGNDIINLLVGTYTNTGSKGIYSLSFDQTSGESMLLDTAETENPSFLTLSPDKRTLYAVNESGKPTDSVTAFAFDKENGKLKRINSEAVNGAAPCYVSTNGKYVLTANYTSGSITVLPTDSNRLRNDGIAIYKVNRENGTLTPVAYRNTAAHPRNFAISPNGEFLLCACRDTNVIQVYRINDNGTLSIKGTIDIPAPVCVLFDE